MPPSNREDRFPEETEPLLDRESSSQPIPRRCESFGLSYRGTMTALRFGCSYLPWIFLPLGSIARLLHWNDLWIFLFNLLAIPSLSAVISSSSDELADYLGELAGGLINATFGNAVELTAGVLALVYGDILFAQSVMIGSILSDVLLVFGCCLVSASYNKDVLYFNTAVAQPLSSLMTITAVTIILPTALYSTFPSANLEDTIISFSRSTSIVLLALYVGYLYFHLGTHKHLFESQKPDDSNESPRHGTPHSTYITSTLKLVAAAIVTVICTRFLFESIHGTTKVTGLTKTFIAVILIPIASNSPEGTAVIAAAQVGDVDSAIGVIVNSTLQIGLFVIPFLVILGWMIYQPMTLYFETSHTVILFLSIIVVNHLLQDGRYTYIHGVMLVALYFILVSTFYAY